MYQYVFSFREFADREGIPVPPRRENIQFIFKQGGPTVQGLRTAADICVVFCMQVLYRWD